MVPAAACESIASPGVEAKAVIKQRMMERMDRMELPEQLTSNNTSHGAGNHTRFVFLVGVLFN